jgi:transposase
MAPVEAGHFFSIHIVMDNDVPHKTPKINAWCARRPHYQVHFTPTFASWINQVERWFAELTRKQIQRPLVRTASRSDVRKRAPVDTSEVRPSLAVSYMGACRG